MVSGENQPMRNMVKVQLFVGRFISIAPLSTVEALFATKRMFDKQDLKMMEWLIGVGPGGASDVRIRDPTGKC